MSEFEYTVGRPVLTVSGLTFSYGKGRPNVLRDLSFEIHDITRPAKGSPEGELIVVLGESGSGKSTLLGLLSGLLVPQAGTIQMIESLGSEKMVGVKPGMVGVVDPAKHPLRAPDGLQELAFGGQAEQGALEQQQPAVNRILKHFGLEGHGNKYPGQLSGGQRQRVAIARQILRQPSVIIFDEPFSGLDYRSKMRAVDLIQDVSNIHTDQVVMVITHDIYVAVQIADRILYLEQREDGSGGHIGTEYDLMKRGISWRQDNTQSQEYASVVHEIQMRSLGRG